MKCPNMAHHSGKIFVEMIIVKAEECQTVKVFNNREEGAKTKQPRKV